jgi:hypothetical protein
LSTAQPFLTEAGKTSVSNIGSYMNPYNDAVVSRIGELGRRNLNELLLPEVEGRYVKAGQLGFGPRDENVGGTPSGMMLDLGRTLRDTNADILAAQSAALKSGFGEAAGLAGTDLTRFGNLATTAGNLAQTQQEQQLAASGALSNLGVRAQELGLTGAGALAKVGEQEQQLGQKNLDVAYADFLRQQGYDQEQINNKMAAFKGVATGVPQADTTYGISPSGVKQEYTSTGQDIASVLAAAAGLYGKVKGV